MANNSLNYNPKNTVFAGAIQKMYLKESAKAQAEADKIVFVNNFSSLDLGKKTIHIKEGVYTPDVLSSLISLLNEKTKPTCGTCTGALCEKCEGCEKCEKDGKKCTCNMIQEAKHVSHYADFKGNVLCNSSKDGDYYFKHISDYTSGKITDMCPDCKKAIDDEHTLQDNLDKKDDVNKMNGALAK